MKVQLFITCLADQFFPDILRKIVLVLERLGIEVAFPQNQTCCGQPLFNSGFQADARGVARHWLDVFGKTEGSILSPSGSCVDMVRHHYAELFPDGTSEHARALEVGARTFEFSEFLVERLHITDVGARFPYRVTYHASCHLLRGLGVREPPKQLLRATRGLELVPLEEEGTCCGFGGTFSVIYPEVSRSMMQAKVKNIEASGAQVVVMNDPGCLMNLRGGMLRAGSRVRAMHLAEVLASQE